MVLFLIQLMKELHKQMEVIHRRIMPYNIEITTQAHNNSNLVYLKDSCSMDSLYENKTSAAQHTDLIHSARAQRTHWTMTLGYSTESPVCYHSQLQHREHTESWHCFSTECTLCLSHSATAQTAHLIYDSMLNYDTGLKHREHTYTEDVLHCCRKDWLSGRSQGSTNPSC